MTITQRQIIPSPVQPKVITAEKLIAGYEDNIVWRDANFTIDRGEFVAVIGPNGAGKTTLFRLLLGLQRPAGGTIKLFDSEPKRGNPDIGYVPQRHLIDSETNVESLELVHLAFCGHRWGFHLSAKTGRKAALVALEAVGATELAHQSLNALSGGELQRIFLAEALVSNPSLLLLDEPLANLDIRRENDLLQLVNNVVRSRSVTALLIAHNINPLLPYLDKVVYIANGKVATGTPQEVLTSECLSALFEVHVEVLRDSRGNIGIVGIEDYHRCQPE
jgi:zinc/manganese transport system ATP-binding protein